MEQIPVLDLKPEIGQIWNQLQTAIWDVLRSGQFIMGPNVEKFEQEIAEYLGVEHAISLNSGTDALFIALKALRIGPGDEVITTGFTFFATAEAISHVGAKPVFVDVDSITYNMNPALLAEALTPRTKAIVPVHLYGHAVDMQPVMEFAEKHGLRVVEDVAQAFGGSYNGLKLGTIGSIGTFSFFPSKNLGAYGDGGMLVTNDPLVAKTARMLRVHGSLRKYHNEIVGYNSRLDEIQAAILRVKLPFIEEWNAGRRAAAGRYSEMLRGVSGIQLPLEAGFARHVYHQFTIRVLNGRRDEVQKCLAKQGVSSMVYYPVPVHRLPVYAEEKLTLPTSDQLATEVLSLPIWPAITEEQQLLVAQALKRALA